MSSITCCRRRLTCCPAVLPQYFDEKYVPGVGTEGEKRNKYEQWVPCTEEDRSATGVGCIKQGDAADMYELRISIKCSHTDHVDEADVTLAVTVPNDGGDLNVSRATKGGGRPVACLLAVC